MSTNFEGTSEEILGDKRADMNHHDGIQYREFGIMTPRMSFGKIHYREDLSKEEVSLGIGMLEMIEDDRLRNYYSDKSIERSQYYSYDRVMKSWDDLIEKVV